MEAFADEGINELACMCSAQSAKTLTILCLLAWAIVNDPGPILWVTSDVQEARKFAKSRLIPLLERCPPVAAKFPQGRGSKNTLEIYFPGAPLIITGAKSPASLQSTPFRYIFLDEVRSYPPGALEMVEKRTRSYPHNYKKVIISTPDAEGDALHKAFLKGDQRHFHAVLPCGHAQELVWGEKEEKGGLKWETSNTTKPDGKWDHDKLRPTVHYECKEPDCPCQLRDTLTARKQLSSHGHWVKENPLAPSNCASFMWNALLPWWTSWGDQLVERITALEKLDWGNHEGYKSFINETCGLPWTDHLRYLKADKFLKAREGYLPHRGAKERFDYDPTLAWPYERRRFATIDVQAKGGRHYYLVIRAWGSGGVTRQLYNDIFWGNEGYQQLMATCDKWNVPLQNRAFDVGTFQTELFAQIMAAGSLPDGNYAMKALWGDKDRREAFIVDGVRHLFTTVPTDPALGTRQQGRQVPILVWRWAKQAVQEKLAFFMGGGGDTDWCILKNADMDYRKQVTAWDRREFHNARGELRSEFYKPEQRPDHYYSCELMQLVCASATGLLSAPREDLPLFDQQK